MNWEDFQGVNRAYVLELYDQFERLAQFPGIGHTRRELRDDTLRVVAVFSFLIIFLMAPTLLDISRCRAQASRELAFAAAVLAQS